MHFVSFPHIHKVSSPCCRLQCRNSSINRSNSANFMCAHAFACRPRHYKAHILQGHCIPHDLGCGQVQVCLTFANNFFPTRTFPQAKSNLNCNPSTNLYLPIRMRASFVSLQDFLPRLRRSSDCMHPLFLQLPLSKLHKLLSLLRIRPATLRASFPGEYVPKFMISNSLTRCVVVVSK